MQPILGGILIGISASLMLLFNGKITGISGMVGSLLSNESTDQSFRWFFLGGLLTGGIILNFSYPIAFNYSSHVAVYNYLFSGLLVGFGTLVGNGCTSGHGVCGISRFSIRSIAATFIFIITGIIGVVIFKILHGNL